MASIDYAKLADVAAAKIAEFGRSVTFRRLDQAPATVAKPWEGPTDANAGYDAEEIISGLQVHPESAVELGLVRETSDLMKLSEMILITAPGTAFTEDITTFDEVLDDGVTWKITGVQELKPATQVLLHFVGLTR